MNYQRHYGQLIERARARGKLEVYTERHHVVPRCLGGSDELSNLVHLTPEEHYVAHQLLAKMHPGIDKIVYAACLMAQSPNGARSCNRLYGWLKRRLARTQSIRFSGKVWTPEQNAARSTRVVDLWSNSDFRARATAGMRGKSWSEERRAAKSASMRGKPGRVWTAEQKAKLSETKRKQYAERSMS